MMDNEQKKDNNDAQAEPIIALPKKKVGRPKTKQAAPQSELQTKKAAPSYIEREYIRPTERISARRQKKTQFPKEVQQLPGKHYCWVLEQDIQLRINEWYDFAKDKNGNRVRMVANKSVAMTALNRMQYLMMVDEKHYREYCAEQQKSIIDLKRKRTTLQAGQYLPRSA